MKLPAPSSHVLEPAQVRAINNRIREVCTRGVGPPTGDIECELLCECGDESCSATLALTLGEYEALHWISNCFAVAPGHEPAWAAQVVSERGGYVVVERR